jgi:hypothetical protein
MRDDAFAQTPFFQRFAASTARASRRRVVRIRDVDRVRGPRARNRAPKYFRKIVDIEKTRD